MSLQTSCSCYHLSLLLIFLVPDIGCTGFTRTTTSSYFSTSTTGSFSSITITKPAKTPTMRTTFLSSTSSQGSTTSARTTDMTTTSFTDTTFRASSMSTATTTLRYVVTSTMSSTATLSTATTTEPRPKLDSNCAGKDNSWCNIAIFGPALCDKNTSKCMCYTSYFRQNIYTCLHENRIIPRILSFSENNSSSTSLTVRWQMTGNIRRQFSVTCIGVKSNVTKIQTQQSYNIFGEAVFTDLISGDEYDVTVIAYIIDDVNDVHSGTQTTRQAIDPAMPGEVSPSNYTAPNILLTWRPSAGLVDYYTVLFQNALLNTSDNEAIIRLYHLKAGKIYQVAITAVSHGRLSEVRQDIFTTHGVAPDPPQNITVVASTKTSITLHWDPPTIPNGNLKGYLVCYKGRTYSDIHDGSMTSCITVENIQVFEVGSLKPGAFYDFQIFASNTAYNSTDSGKLLGVRTVESVPGKITRLTVQVQYLKFLITWHRPAEPNGDIIQYRIDWISDYIKCTDYLKTERVNTTNIQMNSQNCSNNGKLYIDVNQRELNYTIAELTPYTSYIITVTPYTRMGQGTTLSSSYISFPSFPSSEIQAQHGGTSNQTSAIIGAALGGVAVGSIITIGIMVLILKRRGQKSSTYETVHRNRNYLEHIYDTTDNHNERVNGLNTETSGRV